MNISILFSYSWEEVNTILKIESPGVMHEQSEKSALKALFPLFLTDDLMHNMSGISGTNRPGQTKVGMCHLTGIKFGIKISMSFKIFFSCHLKGPCH